MHNRNTTAGEKVWDRLVRHDALGEIEFTRLADPDRPTRLVQQTVYRESVTLPARKGGPTVTVTAILAREAHPPAGQKAIEWRLLTHRTAEPLEAVVELVDGYRRRWLADFFRIWKSGCRVEALQLGTLERLERALVLQRFPA